MRTIFSWKGDQLRETINPLWGSITYAYDKGRISKVIYPDGLAKTFSWDQKSKLKSISSDLRTISFNRDSEGMLQGLHGPMDINRSFSLPQYHLNIDKKIMQIEADRVLCTDVYIFEEGFVSPQELVKNCDIIIVGAAHKEYATLIIDDNKILVDVWNFYGKGGLF